PAHQIINGQVSALRSLALAVSPRNRRSRDEFDSRRRVRGVRISGLQRRAARTHGDVQVGLQTCASVQLDLDEARDMSPSRVLVVAAGSIALLLPTVGAAAATNAVVNGSFEA